MRLPNHQCERNGCRRAIEPHDYEGRRLCAKHAAVRTDTMPRDWLSIDPHRELRLARMVPGVAVRWALPGYISSREVPKPYVERRIWRIVSAAYALMRITGKNASFFIGPLYGISQHGKEDFEEHGYMQTMQMIAVMTRRTLCAQTSVVDGTRVFCTRTGALAVRYDGETRRRVFGCEEYKHLGTHVRLGGNMSNDPRLTFIMERHKAHCDQCGKEEHGSAE